MKNNTKQSKIVVIKDLQDENGNDPEGICLVVNVKNWDEQFADIVELARKRYDKHEPDNGDFLEDVVVNIAANNGYELEHLEYEVCAV